MSLFGACRGTTGLLVFLWAATALALPAVHILKSTEIEFAFAGKTLTGIYRDGLKWTESYHSDRTLLYVESGDKMTGNWFTAGTTFCTFYNERESGGCFMVTQIGTNCYDFSFISRDTREASDWLPKSLDWDARGWRVEAPSTCEDEVTS